MCPYVVADTMASASPKVLEDIKANLLTCRVCLNAFNQRDRLPRMLPCQHSFCGPCLVRLGESGQLSCPNCRHDFEVAGPFPVDTTRSALLDSTEVLQTAEEKPCEGCDDGGQATSHCMDCCQALCEDCVAAHKRVKTARNHVLVSLEKAAASPSLLLPKVEKCQSHEDEKIKFYCKTCKTPVCSSCVILLHKDRDGHDIVELSEAVEKAKGQVSGRLQRVSSAVRRSRVGRSNRSHAVFIVWMAWFSKLNIIYLKAVDKFQAYLFGFCECSFAF